MRGVSNFRPSASISRKKSCHLNQKFQNNNNDTAYMREVFPNSYRNFKVFINKWSNVKNKRFILKSSKNHQNRYLHLTKITKVAAKEIILGTSLFPIQPFKIYSYYKKLLLKSFKFVVRETKRRKAMLL